MDLIKRQLQDLNIPYPQKFELQREVEQDLENIEEEFLQPFSNEDLMQLQNIHSTKTLKFLNKFSNSDRKILESFAAFLPLGMLLFFTIREDSMSDFIREGGIPGMITILAIGGVLFGREILTAFRLIFVKDHSIENLKMDTPSVALGCLALVFIGLGQASLGLYISADGTVRNNASYDLLLMGAKESMTPIILSAFLSSIIALFHYGTRRVMHIWRAPVA